MREYNSNFHIINEQDEKEPRYVIEISFDNANTDTVFLTSHNDCDIPVGSTVIYGVINDLSGTSQDLDPIKANSTIGNLNFSVSDINNTLTSLIYNKLYPAGDDVPVNGLRHKRAQLSIGFIDLSFSDYEIPAGGTQIIDNISYNINDGQYRFSCSDIQRTIRKSICDPKISTLLTTINSTQTGIPIDDVSELELVFHGPSYSDSPNLSIGYIELNKETISWRQKLETAVSETGTDISFAGNTITSTTTDLSVFGDLQTIVISGTVNNNGTFHISGTPTSTTINVDETFITEVAGSSFNIFASVQVYQCIRGVLNTKAIEHEVGADTDVDKRPKVQEVIYIQLPAVKALYAFLTGTIYGDSATFPDHWHLNIQPANIQTSAFTGIGTDWWDTSDDTIGVPCDFHYLDKIDGKSFLERELLLLLGAFMPVTSTGELSLKRMTYVGADTPHHHVLDKSNIISISKLNHDMKSVYNRFLFKWNYDRFQKDFTRKELLIDLVSLDVHQDTPILVVPFKGMHGATYTKARAHVRRDSARDRYIAPPEGITVVCSPEMNKVEIGDIVHLQLEGLPDYISGTDIDRSFEVQKVFINWINGRVGLKLFGSTQRPSPLPTLSTTTVIPDANYTSLGIDISTVTNGTDIGGTWTINADSVIYGSGTMGSLAYTTGTVSATNGSAIVTGSGTLWSNLNNTNIDIDGNNYEILSIDSDTQITLFTNFAEATDSGLTYNLFGAIYYWDGDIELQSGKTLTIHDNIRIRYTGEFVNNGIIDGIGNGRKGKTVTTTPGEIGYVGNTKAGGGGYISTSFRVFFISNDSPVVSGLNIGITAINIEWDGSSLKGLDNLDMRPSSGGSGNHFTLSTMGVLDGGNGGNGGASLILEGRGATAGISSQIKLSGNDGELGSYSSWADWLFRAGTGAGGAGGPLLVILDGSFPETFNIFTNFTSNLGNSFTGTKMPIIKQRLLYLSKTERYYSFFYGFTSRSNKSSLYREIRLATFTTPVADVATISENPTALNLAEGVSSKQSLNLAAIEVSVTPPVGDNSYYGSAIYARVTGTVAFDRVGEVIGNEEIVIQVPNYNSSYDFRANPISVSKTESSSFIEASILITSVSLSAELTAGSNIHSGQDSYNSGSGFFLGNDVGDITLSGITQIFTLDIRGVFTATLSGPYGYCWSNDGLVLFITTRVSVANVFQFHSNIPNDFAGLPLEYSVGNISVVNGSPTVTLTGGGSWAGFHNTQIIISTSLYSILSFDSDTQLTLTINYPGSTGSKTYETVLWDFKIGVNTQASQCEISPDGTKFFILHNTGPGEIREYDLSTPNNITTLVYNSVLVNLNTILSISDFSWAGLIFKPDGKKIIVSNIDSTIIYAIDFTAAWDLSSPSYTGETVTLAGITYPMRGIGIIPNGYQIVVTATENAPYTDSEILLFDLLNSWDLSGGAVLSSSTGTLITGSVFTQPLINSDGTELTVVDFIDPDFYTYSINSLTKVKVSIGAGDGNQDIIFNGSSLIYNGQVNSNEGSIGGWNTTITTIVSDNNRVIMDAGNQHIQGQNAAGDSYTRINLNGLTAVDSVFGEYFRLPTNGILPIIGKEFRIRGGVSYPNIINMVQGRLVDFNMDLSTSAGSTEDKSAGIYTFENTTSGTGVDKSQLIYASIKNAHSWDFGRLFKTAIAPFTGAALGDVSIYVGESSGANNHIGFRFDGDGNIYAIYGVAGTATETNIRSYSDSIFYILEIEYTVTQILFYVNNILEHTATVDLPTGLIDASNLLTLELNKTDIATSGFNIKVEEFSFQQDSSDNTNINVNTDNLIITTYQADINTETNVLANTDTLVITTYQAVVTLI